MTRDRIVALLGYTAFFWTAFFLCAYWSFPYERLAAFITDKVAESGSGYTLEIGALSPSWLTGVELEQVKVQRAAETALQAPSGDKGGPIVDHAIRIPEAHARMGLFALLTGSTDVSFSADLGTGEIEGSYAEDAESKHVLATFSKVDLGKLGVLESLVSLPMKGQLTGDFDLTLGAQPSKTVGTIKLKIEKLTVGDGKAKLKVGSMGGLTIDPVSAGDLVVEIDVKEGVGNVRKMTTDGPDLKLEGSGDVRFAQPLSRSRLGLLLKLRPTEVYANKSARTKAMFALLESSSVPQVAAAKGSDGSYQIRVSGTLTSARVLPAGQRDATALPGAVPNVMPMPSPAPGDEEED
jgi:type II secretion system protein N